MEDQQDAGKGQGAQQQLDPGNPTAVKQRGDNRREKPERQKQTTPTETLEHLILA